MLAKIELPNGAEVLVVTACAPPYLYTGSIDPSASYAMEAAISEAWTELRSQALAMVTESANRLSSAGLNAKPLVGDGTAANVLLELADEKSAYLIAIGGRGLGGIKGLVLGSVARKLISHSKHSVLVAHTYNHGDPDAAVTTLQAKKKLKAVLAFDGSEGARKALAWAVTHKGAFEQVVVATIEPLSPLPPGLDPAGASQMFGFDHEAAIQLAQSAADQLGSGVGVARTKLGRPAHEICAIAQETGADLIIASAQGHGALERFLLGSVTDEIASSAPCSVLIVR